jgi:hypothetical protein
LLHTRRATVANVVRTWRLPHLFLAQQILADSQHVVNAGGDAGLRGGSSMTAGASRSVNIR